MKFSIVKKNCFENFLEWIDKIKEKIIDVFNYFLFQFCFSN